MVDYEQKRYGIRLNIYYIYIKIKKTTIMKRIAILIGLLFSVGVVFAQPEVTVTVSGISNPSDMNGVYTQIGERNDRPYFEYIPEGSMDVYTLFYRTLGMGGEWIIYPGTGPGPDTGMPTMWDSWSGYFSKSGTEEFPPISDYQVQPPIMGITVAGDPKVNSTEPIPVAMWSVVFVFAIIGGVLVYRHYKGQQQTV